MLKTNPAATEYRDRFSIFGSAFVITLMGFLIAYQFVDPAPPRTLTMATGSPRGAYHATGEAYRDFLARYGVSLQLKNTAGSIENLGLLTAGKNGVDVAIIQGGLSQTVQNADLVALGSLFLEPLWIFHRSGIAPTLLTDLKGLKIAVGQEGSGTRVLVMKLLALNGITTRNSQIFSFGGQQAVDMLIAGDIDIAFFVVSHRAKYIHQLAKAKTIGLMGLDRAEAYAIRNPYLRVLKLPEGVINLQTNIPERDLSMVAPTAQLVARPELHPALIELLLQAAVEVHFQGGGFEAEGQFPSPKGVDYELSPEAARFYKSGPKFLQRYLPFWVANFLSRMKVMLLPLIVLLFPVVKLLPPVYRWRMRSKIYRWYAQLDAIDVEITHGLASSDIESARDRLNELEKRVAGIAVPLSFREELYDLRLHIQMLQNKLANR